MYNGEIISAFSKRAVVLWGTPGAGQATLLNALFRKPELLSEEREFGRCLPLWLESPPGQRDVSWQGRTVIGSRTTPLDHKKALSLLKNRDASTEWACLEARIGRSPFPGLGFASFPVLGLHYSDAASEWWTPPGWDILPVIILPVSSAGMKNHLEFLSELRDAGRSPLIVLGKADQIEYNEYPEVRRVLLGNLAKTGWKKLPAVFFISGLWERERSGEVYWRRRAVPKALEFADAEFDRLRLALYEFEAATRYLVKDNNKRQVTFFSLLTTVEGSIFHDQPE